MRVGYYQFAPEFGAPARNLERVSQALAGLEADVVVLPELAFSGYLFEDRAELRAYAEDLDGSPVVEGLHRLCRENTFYIVAGLTEGCGERLYNAAVVIGPEGLVYRYRKIHLFKTEKEYFDPGDAPPGVVDIPGARLGVMICFDWAFPEVARSLALQGAELLCHPSNLVLDYCQRAMFARSVENGLFSITANRTGKEVRPRGELTFTGQSQILGPKGEGLAGSSQEAEELVLREANIPAARDKSMTESNDLFADRRPELYFIP